MPGMTMSVSSRSYAALLQRRERGAAVADRGHVVAVIGERALHELAHRFVIFSQQNCCHQFTV